MSDLENVALGMCERLGMTPDECNTALANMTAQREQELAGVEAHYKLRKACTARAVELYEALSEAWLFSDMRLTQPEVQKLLNEIKDDAK